MLNPNILVVFFSVALVLSYSVVRMGWVRPIPVFAIGTVIISLLFFLYAMSRGNPFSHALVIGPLLGVVFTGISVAMGLFFRAVVAEAAPERVVKSATISGSPQP